MKLNKFPILVVLLIMGTMTVQAQLIDTKALSISLVNQDPDPATPGDIVEVRLGVENIGGKAVHDLIIELTPEYPLELVPGEDAIQKVGTLQAYQYDDNMKIVKYRLRVNRDAIAGSYELKIRYYEEGSTSETQKSLSIDVEGSESAEVIHIDKSILVPGKEDTLKFTINNVGNAPLRELTFYWENEDGVILPVGSDNTRYIKYIDVGDGAELEYRVIADTNADPGLYQLDLHLTYDDPLTGTETEISTIAGVYVGGGTDFEVAFSESSSGTTSFSIANIGSNPAYSVSVIIPKQEGWAVSGSNSMIIGNLNNGDYTVASFALQSARTRTQPSQNWSQNIADRTVQDSSPGSEITVQVAYTDTRGERHTIDKMVQLNMQSMASSTETDTATTQTAFQGRRVMQQQSFFSQYKWYIIGSILLVGVVYLRHVYKKRKTTDPNFKLRDFFHKKKK